MWPEAFIQRIKNQFPDDGNVLLESLDNDARTSIRINPLKFKDKICEEHIKHSVWGYLLKGRPIFSLDPLWHSGCYYVQESSSMFIEQLIKIIRQINPKPLMVMDLCAAPGGKSTHLCSLLKPDDYLVSNEVISSRIPPLKENLIKWGYPNILINNNDPRQIGTIGSLFDLIVVDAPCSGEGLFRRNKNAAKEWSVENTNLCKMRQQRILSDIIPCLKKDGFLIYSTCTFNSAENEENIAWLAHKTGCESIRIPIDPEWNVDEVILKDTYGYRFLPHKSAGEGFFISLLQKKSESKRISFQKQPTFKRSKEKSADFIQSSETYTFIKQHDDIRFIPTQWEKEISYLLDKLSVSHYGTGIGQIIDNKLIPNHELAMSTKLNRQAFPITELTLNQSLSFLRKETFDIPLKSDWQLMTYRGYILGFIKKIGSRFNNYYPKEWRLRSTNNVEKLWHENYSTS